MYVDPFVAGVIATIVVEMILAIGFALISGNKKNND